MTTRAIVPVGTTSPVALVGNSVRDRLIEREKALIANAQKMVDASRQEGNYHTWGFSQMVIQGKERLLALKAGLLPVRIGGKFATLRELLSANDFIPPSISAMAAAIKERLPKAQMRVYGWDAAAVPAVRKARDPILTAYLGGAEFFVGFWLEVAGPDEAVPDFFGMTTPMLPKPGRGRPRKIGR